MKLLPCPFCGSRDITMQRLEDGIGIGCMTCEIHGRGYESYTDAINAWNLRDEPSFFRARRIVKWEPSK